MFESIALWFSTHLAQVYVCDIKPDVRVKITRDHDCLWVRYCAQSTLDALDVDDDGPHPFGVSPLPLRTLAKLNPSAETIALLAKLSPDDI